MAMFAGGLTNEAQICRASLAAENLEHPSVRISAEGCSRLGWILERRRG